MRTMVADVVRQDDDLGLAEALDTDGLGVSDWVIAGSVFVVAVALGRVVAAVMIRVLRRHVDPALAILIGRTCGYVVLLIGIAYGLDSIGVRIGPVLGALGIAGIALAFALQDILENFVAGVLLQYRRPFHFGDQISVNEHEGTVLSVDSRVVVIESPDGETIKIPTATVIKSDINNYTEHGARRSTLEVGVAYGTDLGFAQRVLAEAARSVEGVHSEPDTEALVIGFGDSSIDFAVRYWHGPTIVEFWRTRSDVALAVERALSAAEITIPFPQRTVWGATASGSSG
jgi:small conductance mechanosensitive channel